MAELALIGLASNILQFLEFGTKVFRTTKELYTSAAGATVEDAALEADVQELQRLVELVSRASSTCEDGANSGLALATAQQLRNISVACEKAAQGLTTLLNDRKVDPSGSKRFIRSIEIAVGAVRSRDRNRIAAMQELLEKLHNRLFQCLTLDLKNQQSAIFKTVKELQGQGNDWQSKITAKLEQIEGLLNLRVKEGQHYLIQPQLYASGAETLEHFIQQVRQTHKRQDILGSLYFKSLRERQSAIRDRHRATFQWIFGDKTSKFCHWLQSEQDIFWVRGKAGSGKSTLMKFLSSHPDCRKHLGHWTGHKRLIIAHHFFWNAGNMMQKSRLGLFQTLVFQILKECPELLETTCAPERWNASSKFDQTAPWTESELMETLKKLADQEQLPLKFCFFIDGLDEYTEGQKRYHGTFAELLDPIKRLASSPSVKICVSSRPWTIFDVEFGAGDYHLRLEDLTQDDIKRYVDEELGSHPKFMNLALQDTRCAQIAPTIVSRAQGVFLWVFLVVEEIKKGLSNLDTYRNLEYRLNSLPSDLNDYFAHMLESIESVYWEETCRIFQVMVTAYQALPLLSFHFLDQEMEDPDYVMKQEALPFGLGQLEAIHKTQKARINARCMDLLYVTPCSDTSETTIQFKVDFLHRTVRDFFTDTDALDQLISARTGSMAPDFDALISLCRLHLGLSKTLPFGDPASPDFNQVFTFADSLMFYALQIEHEEIPAMPNPIEGDTPQLSDACQSLRLKTLFRIMDELDNTNNRRVSSQIGFHWVNSKDPPKGLFQEYRKKNYLAAAIQSRLSLYAQEKMRDDPKRHINQKQGRPLLDYALRPTMVTPVQLSRQEDGPVKYLVEMLLTHGADPNRGIFIYDGKTPWELFLGACYRHDGQGKDDELVEELGEVILIMIRYGANAQVMIEVMDDSSERKSIWDVVQRLGLQPGYNQRLASAIAEKQTEQRQNWGAGFKLASFLWGS